MNKSGLLGLGAVLLAMLLPVGASAAGLTKNGGATPPSQIIDDDMSQGSGRTSRSNSGSQNTNTSDEQSSISVTTVSPQWLQRGVPESVSILMDDQVTGQCWTNAASIESAAAQRFRNAGYTIVPFENYAFDEVSFAVRFSSVGYRSGGQCIMLYNMEVYAANISYMRVDDHVILSAGPTVIHTLNGVLNGPNSSARIKSLFLEGVDEFIVLRKQNLNRLLLEARDNATTRDARNYWQNYLPNR